MLESASIPAAVPAPLLQVNHLHVGFGGQDVVKDLSFSIQAGEKLALVGESGSGKTITALSLLRLVGDAQLRGEALMGGRNLLQISEREIQAVRGDEIAVIFQEPMTALNPLLTMGAQIAEVLQLKRGMGDKEAWAQAVELLATTGIREPERRAGSYPHQLSGGQRQRAMIAMALASRPKLLIADEPTTALDVSLRGQILELLSDLQRQTGMAVLMITHDLPLVRHFADRVAVMEKGRLVEQGPVADVFAAPQHPYTQKLLASTPQRQVVARQPDAPAVLQTQGLQVSYATPLPGIRGWFRKGRFDALRGASMVLGRGQTLGVIGESGSGKSTLAQAILGLLPSQGELRIDQQSWQQPPQHNSASNQQLRRKVQVVFQDPFSSLSPRMTVQEIVGEGLQLAQPGLSAAQLREQVLAMLNEVGMTEVQFPELLDRYPHAFSGGQRQRLAIARALIVDPEILVLDEPTSALDVTIQQQVLALLQRLQRERGLSYLLITHDVAVIRAMAHEVLVMKDGEVVEAGEVMQVLDAPREAYTQRLMAASLELS
ncbi:ABC transporter ATP-binding protein [Comamonas piscis]|uniref:ABC transporter ATP-binding protein n=1 Tax=Comamonas piscis TaxID=1562974 RepID=A0A7G5EJK3_9BURK|nr:dipeptide ABC transporter ATP-binding protein [Comamonas piscis]QMV74178.1 ABC transporter ATP-binding protein [Comamonas piscis]WSO32618.1 dipeptide ABC transporter ATP-binding protein [Comamonas piscis]